MTYGSPAVQPPSYSVLAVLHENGYLHFRLNGAAHPYVLKVLSSLGYDVWVELDGSMESDCVRVSQMALNGKCDEALAADLVGRLVERGVNVHGYATHYDSTTPGPLVRYHSLGPSSPYHAYPVVHAVDYGFNDGTHVFGHPHQVTLIYALATEAGLVTYPVWEGSRLVSFSALDGDLDSVFATYRRIARGAVSEDTFSPEDH